MGIIVLQLIQRFKIKSFFGLEIVIAPKDKGITRYLGGGSILGLGWALAVACPGPMFFLAGAGYLPILIIILASILGTYFMELLKINCLTSQVLRDGHLLLF
tara:strand:- start:39254 stop:39559 length:306 start_codon:yes stop_codon:yes gene_type:complete